MESKGKNLTKNTIIIFISKFCTQFLSFLLLPILTSLLSTEEYGTFDLITTYACLLTPFMSLLLENGIFRFLIDTRNNKEDTNKIITNGMVGIFLQLIIFSIIYFIIINIFPVNNSIYIYIYAFSSVLLNIFLQISRGLGDNVTYAISSIITGVSNVLICFICVYCLRIGLLGMVIAGTISNVLGGLFALLKKHIISYFQRKSVNKQDMKTLANYSAPLVPNSLSSWLISISDKIMISFFIGTSANGIYSISTKFSILMSHIYSVFNLSWTESASISSKDNKKEQFFELAIDNIFRICILICLLMLAVMPIIFRIMIDESFSESYIYIPLLIIGNVFEILSGLLGAIYISLKLSKNIAISTFIAGIVNVVINLIFMKKYGIIVACISTIASYVILTIYRILDLKKHINVRLNKKTYIETLIMMLIIIYLYYKNSIIVSIVSIILILLYGIIFNYKFIKNIWSMIRSNI